MQHKKTNKVKIGISTRPERRRASIDRAMNGRQDGDVELLVSRPVFFARRFESFLHGVFRHKNFNYRRSGSGSTEWFRLHALYRVLAFLIIQGYWLGCVLFASALLFSILFTAASFLHSQNV